MKPQPGDLYIDPSDGNTILVVEVERRKDYLACRCLTSRHNEIVNYPGWQLREYVSRWGWKKVRSKSANAGQM